MKLEEESVKACPYEPAYQLAFAWRGREGGGHRQERREKRDREEGEMENESRRRGGGRKLQPG